MCGRYSLSAPTSQIIEQFEIEEEIALFEKGYRPRYNIAPGQEIPTIRKDSSSKKRRIDFLQWRFIPSWTKDLKKLPFMINARGETIATKPSFRNAFKYRRCIVPASFFYEWQKTDMGKQPMLIKKKNEELMGIAGLWETWNDNESNKHETVLLITTNANSFLEKVHDRMPVILEKKFYSSWLDCNDAPVKEFDADLLQSFLRPLPDFALEMYPVSTRINSIKNDDPECIKRI